MYHKSATLKRLKKPYKGSIKIPQSRELILLKAAISTVNRNTRKAGDFVQSKYQAREKFKHLVQTPKIYYYGSDMDRISKTIMTLKKFVMKPNNLSRGLGIRILTRDGELFTDDSGEVLTLQDVVDECKILSVAKRYKGRQGILIEEFIQSHPKLGAYGYADIRCIYFKDHILFVVARLSTESSSGYANTNRGSAFGSYIGGKLVKDGRFVIKGDLPDVLSFYDRMALAGQSVCKTYGYCFLSVDMTVGLDGKVVVMEVEQLPQIQYYLKQPGVKWMTKEIGADRIRFSNPLLKPRSKRTSKGLGVPMSYFR